MSSQNARMFQRADTNANGISNAPVLAESEYFHINDTGEFVIGDGSTAYASLVRYQTPLNTWGGTVASVSPSTKHVFAYDGSNYVNRLLITDDLADQDMVSTAPATGDLKIFDGSNWVPSSATTVKFEDDKFQILDDGDNTKIAAFQCSGITTGTTRTYTLPNNTGTLALLDGVVGGQTLSGGASGGDVLTLQANTSGAGSIKFHADSAYDVSATAWGFGTQSPLNRFHIEHGSSGVASISADADNLLIEDSANTGLTISAGSTSLASIHMGDSANSDEFKIEYDCNTGDAEIHLGAGNGELKLFTGNSTISGTILGLKDFIIEGAGSTGMSIWSESTGTGSIFFVNETTGTGTGPNGDVNFDHTNGEMRLTASAGSGGAGSINMLLDPTNSKISTGVSFGAGIFLTTGSTTGRVAGTTQTQAGGLAVAREITEFSTVANTNDTCTLSGASAGKSQTIINNGANTLQIFPAVGDNLGAGLNLSTTLAAGANVTFTAYDTTNLVVKA